MADEVKGGQYVDESRYFGICEADVVFFLVEPSYTRESAQDDRAALYGWQHVLVYEIAQVFESGDDCLLPALVALIWFRDSSWRTTYKGLTYSIANAVYQPLPNRAVDMSRQDSMI